MNSLNIQFTAHLTEEHQLKAADKLISKLKIQLGQEKEYTEELEEMIKTLKNEIDSLKTQLDNSKNNYIKIANRYSSDINNAVKLDVVYQRQSNDIKELKAENKRLIESRDALIGELIKLRDNA